MCWNFEIPPVSGIMTGHYPFFALGERWVRPSFGMRRYYGDSSCVQTFKPAANYLADNQLIKRNVGQFFHTGFIGRPGSDIAKLFLDLI